MNVDTLERTIRNLKGKGYSAYKSLLGKWQLGEIVLDIQYVQSDPFAPPSQISVYVSQHDAGFPKDTYLDPIRNVACCDFINRLLHTNISSIDPHLNMDNMKNWGEEKGYIKILKPSQFVLSRTSVVINQEFVKAIFSVLLPARGRMISSDFAAKLLCKILPDIVEKSMYFLCINSGKLYNHILCIEDQEDLRCKVVNAGYIAFVKDDSILPRLSGYDDLPLNMNEDADVVSFKSPVTISTTFELKNFGVVKGMCLKKGINLIAGGGFHGKSTLLQALQVGIYNKIPGDGREFVVCDPKSIKIRAENHRVITCVDISPFIDNLPYKKSVKNFCTKDASGSTSQAASIIEAIELGASVIMIDEDTCSSNFLFRDHLMRSLVAESDEPIKTLIATGDSMCRKFDLSIILVAGSCGEWFDIAHTIIQMKDYIPYDVTKRAKEIKRMNDDCNNSKTLLKKGEVVAEFGEICNRNIRLGKLKCPRAPKTFKDSIIFGNDEIDTSAIEQIVESSQLVAIGEAIRFLSIDKFGCPSNQKNCGLRDILSRLIEYMIEYKGNGNYGINQLGGSPCNMGLLSQPRLLEIGACINRLRQLDVMKTIP